VDLSIDGRMQGLDLFSGIGGITKALEGYVRPVAYCEIDPYARGVLLSRMFSGDIPDAPIWDDVSSLRGSMLPSIDIIYGGFPCQDISVAGRQKGLAGKQSGLFFEIMRLAEEIKPSFIFLENVANIRHCGLESVLREMASRGYDCRYGILSARDVGAPHKRDRWFILAHANSDRLETLDGVGQVCEPTDTKLQLCSSTKMQMWDTDAPPVTETCGMANGVPNRVDRMRAVGNAVVPAQAREAFERLMGLKCA